MLVHERFRERRFRREQRQIDLSDLTSIDSSTLSAADKTRIFETNAYRVYPRLKARLAAAG